ncbi:MAG: metallophosphoesterase [Deltaproteobacteria bacterium]|nr:metallophosphoesterase [Deltaproteobacteria bacterium]
MKKETFLWLLWTVLIFSALGCDSASPHKIDGNGLAAVRVIAPGPALDNVSSIEVIVSGDDFTPAIEAGLTESAPNSWAGRVEDIPAGVGRTFVARAMDAAGTVVYSGTATDVTIEKDKTAQVSIFLQQTTAPVPFANAVPMITAFTASSMSVEPGETVSFTVAATDANPEDTLTYSWSADNGVFNTPSAVATVWTSPMTTGEFHISVTVSDPKGATASVSATIYTVYDNAGSADVTIAINTSPEAIGLIPSPTQVDTGETTQLALAANDRDGDTLSFAWTADCDGTFDDATAEDPAFTLGTVAADTCTLSVAISDGNGGANTARITIQTGAGVAVEYLETDTDTLIDTDTPQDTETETVVCGTKTYAFQQGANGYAQATDMVILESDADASFAVDAEMSVDGRYDNAYSNSESQILMRFDNIFNGANGIPADAVVSSAALKVYSVNRTNNNISVHRMLIDWATNATWNSTASGVSADDIEAAATADTTLYAPGYYDYFTFDVREAVVAWQSGQAMNYGWVFLNDGTDGWDILSADSSDVATRPQLLITAEVCGDPGIFDTDTGEDTEVDTGEDSESATGEDTGAVLYTVQDIAMTPGRDETELRFNWYANAETAGMLQMALKADMSGDVFPEAAATTLGADVSPAVTGYYSNKVTVGSLAPNTGYVYRIGDGNGTWTDTFEVSTHSGSFSFLAVGDPQIGAGNTSSDTVGWQDTLAKAIAMFPETAFIASAGDQVNTRNNEDQFNGFFSPQELRSIPVAPALGNHDNGAPNTVYHFNIPNVSSAYGVTEPGLGDYYFTYGDALFVVLNSNNRSGASHEAFIDEVMAAYPNITWKIAMFHHDIYGSAYHALESSIRDFRAALFPIFDEYDFDVVITGHDHSYSRSHVLYGDVAQLNQDTNEDGAIVDPNGTVYFTLNSATGSKYYSLNATQAEYCAVRSQAYVPTFSYITIDGDTLTFDTYQTDTMTTIDTFSIVKTGAEPTAQIASTRIWDSMDDVEESTTDGVIYTDSSDLELIYDSYVSSDQIVGLRFTDMSIPAGATITNAFIQLTCDETDSEAATLFIAGEASDNATPFTADAYNVSSRSVTTASVAWSVPEWLLVGEAGDAQRSPDLSAVIQEVVDRSGWVSGNSIGIIVTGETGGVRHAEAYDGSSADAPLLYVEYTL